MPCSGIAGPGHLTRVVNVVGVVGTGLYIAYTILHNFLHGPDPVARLWLGLVLISIWAKHIGYGVNGQLDGFLRAEYHCCIDIVAYVAHIGYVVWASASGGGWKHRDLGESGQRNSGAAFADAGLGRGRHGSIRDVTPGRGSYKCNWWFIALWPMIILWSWSVAERRSKERRAEEWRLLQLKWAERRMTRSRTNRLVAEQPPMATEHS